MVTVVNFSFNLISVFIIFSLFLPFRYTFSPLLTTAFKTGIDIIFFLSFGRCVAGCWIGAYLTGVRSFWALRVGGGAGLAAFSENRSCVERMLLFVFEFRATTLLSTDFALVTMGAVLAWIDFDFFLNDFISCLNGLLWWVLAFGVHDCTFLLAFGRSLLDID